MEILSFSIGGERWAVAVEHVVEILNAVAVTRLPAAPAVVDGIVDVRGEPVPVLNMRRRLGLPVQPLTPGEHMILVAAAGRRVLLRVDTARDVVSVQDSAIRAMEGVTVAARHVAGTTALPDGLVLIHDPAAFLNEAEADQLDEALAAVMVRGNDS